MDERVLKQYTEEEVVKLLTEQVTEGHPADYERDLSGQLVVYTNVWMWDDGTYHDGPEDPRYM